MEKGQARRHSSDWDIFRGVTTLQFIKIEFVKRISCLVAGKTSGNVHSIKKTNYLYF